MVLVLLSLCLFYLESVLEQKAGAHLKTHTHTPSDLYSRIHCSWAAVHVLGSGIDWCVNMAVLPVEVTDRFRRLHPPTANKTKNPMLCHCHIATLRLPPDWLLPSRTVLTRLDLVPCLSLLVTYTFVCVLIFSVSGWPLVCPEYTMFSWVTEEDPPVWKERLGHAWKQIGSYGEAVLWIWYDYV